MNENVQKLVENTVKDILLGNTALTFLFAVPLAYISKHDLDKGAWILTIFLAPALCGIGTWIVSRVQHHSREFFNNRWLKWGYVAYVLIFTEILMVYSIVQIVRTLIK